MGSGIPLHEALDSLTRVQSDSLSVFVIPEVCNKVSNGYRFSSAIARFPKVFPKTYVALIRGSEETGNLMLVLDHLAEWLERQTTLQQHVKKALTYPIFVIALASVLTLILFKTVIPAILETVVSLGAELPLPTKILLAIITMLESPVFWVFAVAAVAGIAWYLRTEKGWHKFLVACHYTPVLGGILTYSGASRFALTLSMLMESGVDIIRCAVIAADSSGNPLIQKDSIRVVQGLREGRYLSDILEFSPYYPGVLVNMVKVGDESGHMAEAVQKCAGLLEEDTMYRVDMFMNLLEPIVLAGVSLLVGSVLIAILLPMSNMISAL